MHNTRKKGARIFRDEIENTPSFIDVKDLQHKVNSKFNININESALNEIIELYC